MPQGKKTWEYLKEFLEDQTSDVCVLTNKQLQIIARSDDVRTDSDEWISDDNPGIETWANKAKFTRAKVCVGGKKANKFERIG